MSTTTTNGAGHQVELKIVEDATCTYCGCVCDDITLKVEHNHIIEAKNACALGKTWFFSHQQSDNPACVIEGRPAPLEEGIERASRILTAARYPLIYGLCDTTSEAQRVAVAIGDWIGGCVDTTTSASHGALGVAIQEVGEVTCTLGEIKNRGDLIIFWGCNPALTHPRHFTKYSLMPKGTYLPRGRKDRYCVLVDVRKTRSAGRRISSFRSSRTRTTKLSLRFGARDGCRARRQLGGSGDRRSAGDVTSAHGSHEKGEIRCDPVSARVSRCRETNT